MRTPTVKCALDHLLNELHQQVYGQPVRSPVLAALAALSLARLLVLYGLFWYAPVYHRSHCSPGNDLCGLEQVGPGLLFTGTTLPWGLA